MKEFGVKMIHVVNNKWFIFFWNIYNVKKKLVYAMREID